MDYESVRLRRNDKFRVDLHKFLQPYSYKTTNCVFSFNLLLVMMKCHIFHIVSVLFYVLFSIAQNVEFDLFDQDPLNQDQLANDYTVQAENSLLWGPYRSALYLGIRPRLPRSLLSGLMWFSMDDYRSIGSIRHFYEQNDNMAKANWVSYDPRYGGTQVIQDNDCHTNITIDFVKSKDGLSWAVKIKSEPHKGFEQSKISFVWYSGLEGEKEASIDDLGEIERTGILKLENQKNVLGYKGSVKLSGVSEELGAFQVEINDGPKTNRHPLGKSGLPLEFSPALAHHYSLRVPDDNVWQARDIFMTMLQESVQSLKGTTDSMEDIPPENLYIIRDLNDFEGNLHLVQKVYQGSCEFDVIYHNEKTPDTEKITSKNIHEKIEANHNLFDEKFSEYFELQYPYNETENDSGTVNYKAFAKEILSGLLGGLTYMYGDHLVDRKTIFDEDTFESYELNRSPEGPHQLFTLVPSRPFFPRGFYWDEGFHLMPLKEYDSDLVLDIIKSWFNLIDSEGWIAREQILGPEARSRVPSQFQVQSPQIVNPPTLTLMLTMLLEHLSEERFGDVMKPIDIDRDNELSDVTDSTNTTKFGSYILKHPDVLFKYAEEVYPKLKLHFQMLRKTQQGHFEEFDRNYDNSEVFRWRGRTETHCLASGIDDYPRASPADVAELNVDLISWIGIMAKSLRLMAGILNKYDDVVYFQDIEEKISKNLDKVHWSKSEGIYCDVSVDEDDENVHVCHKGYVSLLPFVTKLIPKDDVDKLEKVLNIITDPEELWSPFGIRSLSKSDSNYKTGEDYWRSPVWINMNYLVLKGIEDYYYESRQFMSLALQKKFQVAYHDLRINVVDNVYRQWVKTGFVWEQYNDETGDAKGAKNFLGWTSAVLLMMKMPGNLE